MWKNWYKFYSTSGNKEISEDRYETAIRNYVHSWERWGHEVLPKKVESPSELQEFSRNFIFHLKLTAEQVIIAVEHKEWIGAKWAVDMFIRWYSYIEVSSRHEYSIEGPENFITHTLQADNPIITEINPSEALLVMLRNAHYDMRCMLFTYLIGKIKAQSDEEITPEIKKHNAKPAGG